MLRRSISVSVPTLTELAIQTDHIKEQCPVIPPRPCLAYDSQLPKKIPLIKWMHKLMNEWVVMQKKKSTLSGTISIGRGARVLLRLVLWLSVRAPVSGVAEPTVLLSTFTPSCFLLLLLLSHLWDLQACVKTSSIEWPWLTQDAACVSWRSWADGQVFLTPGPLFAVATATSLWTSNLPHLVHYICMLSSLSLSLIAAGVISFHISLCIRRKKKRETI